MRWLIRILGIITLMGLLGGVAFARQPRPELESSPEVGKNFLVFTDEYGQRHHIVKTREGVFDTLQWAVGEPYEILNYPALKDTLITWFYPLVRCSLWAVQGRFARPGRLLISAFFFSGHPPNYCCDPFEFSYDLFIIPAVWNVTGDSSWENKNFSSYYRVELPPSIPFILGFRWGGDDGPRVYYDDADGFTREEGHFWFTYRHETGPSRYCPDVNCPIWYLWYFPEHDPPVYPELFIRAVVYYFAGPPPFVVNMDRLPDTYRKSGPFKVEARMKHWNGTIESAWLYYSVNYSETVDSTQMELEDLGEGDYLATGYIQGNYQPGDAINYWTCCQDSSGNRGTWAGGGYYKKLFVITEPVNPDADILLVRDGYGYSTYYEYTLLRLGYQYEPTWVYWEHSGIDSSVINYGWSTIIWFGWGCFNTPQPDTTEVGHLLIDFLENGGRLLLVDQDYFYMHNFPRREEVSLGPGGFAYDFLGVESATSDPDTNLTGDTHFTAVDSLDEVSGYFFDKVIHINPNSLGCRNWPDYTTAKAGAVDLFRGMESGHTSGVRYKGNGFKTVFLPWLYEAITSSAYRDTVMARILNWFGTKPGVEKEEKWDVRPSNFTLFQNYPNPFNASTTIRYHLSAFSCQRSAVSLKIYNILGQEVRSLVDKEQAPGYYSVVWDGRDGIGNPVASGVYLCRLEVKGLKAESRKLKAERTRKMVFLR